MTRPLVDHGSLIRIPSIKFNVEGGGLRGCLVNVEDVQELVFGTNALAFWPNGDPKMQKRVTLIHVASRDVEFSGDPVDPPEVVNLWVKGPRVGRWRDAVAVYKEQYGAAPQVGTLVTVRLAELRPSKTKGYKPVKWLSFEFTPESADVKAYADRAEAEHRALTARPPVDTGPDTGWD